MDLIWDIDPAEPKPTFGKAEGSQASIEIYEVDGEREYHVECHCAVCWEINEVGLDTFDPDRSLPVGVYFVRHHVEVYQHYEHSPEYDTWIEVNEDEGD